MDMATSKIKAQPIIESGTTSSTQTGAQTTHTISFSKEFPSVPTVIVSIENTGGIPYSTWIVEVTTTGFVLNTYYSGHSGTRPLKIHWFAIA